KPRCSRRPRGASRRLAWKSGLRRGRIKPLPWPGSGPRTSAPGLTRRRGRMSESLSTDVRRPAELASVDEARAPAPAAGAWEAVYRFVPALDSLRHYSLRALRCDLLAGLTVAAIAVPQAMAYAYIFGLPPQYGLYTAIVMTAVGALFDSSR